ncbi:uncharacterized protein LOC143294190 [Babylonia areolata]|uniref:uncharacterized protein LOC143294190 n=1 Tax=Babylonia areolata TaxID=304850 RepID=UPI003FD4F8EA
MNDYRPVALTPYPFKCFEHLVLRRLLEATRSHQDPLQFAYRPNRSTEDAITTILHSTLKHLEKPKTYTRMLFLGFQHDTASSDAGEADENGGEPCHHSLGSQLPDQAPTGCVMSPALFTIYTADCRCASTSAMQVKFSDDTSLTGFISTDETSYRNAVERLVGWCDENFLQLNATSLLRRGNQRLFYMKKLKAFHVCPKLLELFYRTTVESILTFNSLCIFGAMKEHDKARLAKIPKTASRLIGAPVADLQTLFETKAVRRLRAIRDDESHPLSEDLGRQASARSGRILSVRTRTNRFYNSFIPTAIRLGSHL